MSRALSNRWAPNGQSGKALKTGKVMTSVSFQRYCKSGSIHKTHERSLILKWEENTNAENSN